MNNEKRIKYLPMRKFQELFGVKKLTFYVMFTSFQVFETKRVNRQSKCGRMNDVTQTDYPERGGSHDIIIHERERNWQVAELVFGDFFAGNQTYGTASL